MIGDRPQFIKAAAVSPFLRASAEEVLVHVGERFDELPAAFFGELGVPAPEYELGVALGSSTSQTARMLAALEPLVVRLKPDVLLVYGDANSTLAGALAGAQARIPVAHVEAGMRSFDRSVPGELNRVLSDHVSSLLFCASDTAVLNLGREGVHARIELVGDVMVDVALAVQPRARRRIDLVRARGLEPREYVLATAHQGGNVDEPERLERLVDLMRAIPFPVVWPLHGRTRRRLKEAAMLLERVATAPNILLTSPLAYLELTALLCNARAVLTDSGGIQKEAYLAGVPCLTMRSSTEWVETVENGWNVLVDLDVDATLAALHRTPPSERPRLYGDGRAGERVIKALTLHASAAAAA